uniref:Uncharacterized protein n=1 Tax=Urocitellus parryii TaxID=9999 RepID=A0A8D2HXS7_UROPR
MERRGLWGIPLFLPCPPGDCCKIPNASWHMPKACSAPRRGQPLMRTPEPWQPGQVGALELGSQVPVHTAPAASSLAPSEPVSAGPQHLGREGRGSGPGRWGPSPRFCPLAVPVPLSGGLPPPTPLIPPART